MIQIAIDPGAKGAVMWYDTNLMMPDRGIKCCLQKMPDTNADIIALLEMIKNQDVCQCLIEKVGTYFPGNSGPAAVKFAEHVGVLKAALLALKIPHKFVVPRKWMLSILGTIPPDKKLRKNAIKAKMQEIYPNIKVTLVNADALGMLTYLKQKGFDHV